MTASFSPEPERGPGDASPFSFPGASGAHGVLCLHGFSGTPYEVRPQGESLAAQGFTVLGPVLAGHDGTAAELAATGAHDWLASVESALLALHAQVGGQAVGLFGFSMGGLLALCLAGRHPDKVAALAIGSAPLRLRTFERLGIRALNLLPRSVLRTRLGYLPKVGGSDVTRSEARAENPGLRVMPLAALAGLLDVQEQAKAALSDVRAPTLIMHGRLDRTVPCADSELLRARLGDRVKETVWLERSGHLIGVDVEKDELSAALVRFFQEHLG